MGNILYKGNTVYYKGFPVYTYGGTVGTPPVGGDDIVIPEHEQPIGVAPSIVTTYTPTSSADLSNVANTNKIAIISNSFSATGVTLASGQIIRPAGGVISGTGINLNDAYIENNALQAFSSSATFSSVYDKSRVRPELFGAASGDATDDNAAIDALINNCKFAIGTLNGSYIKNSPSTYTRSGKFSWDMNGAKISVTSTANFRMTTVSVDAVFDFTNTSVDFYNGEFDCTDTYGRLFYFHGQQSIHFDDVYVHDLYSPNAIRAIAFRFSISVNSNSFESIVFNNCRIEDIVAEGDGNYNDTNGLSKAWWYSLSGFTTDTEFSVIHQNNVVKNVWGDDAEAFYAIGGDGILHNGTFILDNEDYRNCTRRAIKCCVSNFTLQNSYIEEMDNSLFISAQQVGTMVDFFSTSVGAYIYDIVVKNNTIKAKDGSVAHYQLLSFTDLKGAEVYNNTIQMTSIENYGGIRLGSGTSFYEGNLEDINIHDNTFINCGIEMLTYYNPLDQIQVTDNSFSYTYTTVDWGSHQATLRTTSASGTKGSIDFLRNTITVNTTSTSAYFNGVIYSQGAAIVNLNITDTTIEYLNAVPSRSFGYLVGNYGATNNITNCTIIGDVGTGSIVISGTGDPVITNSYGDSLTEITVV